MSAADDYGLLGPFSANELRDLRTEVLLLRALERRVRHAHPSYAIAVSLAALDSLRNDRKVTR